MVELRNETAVYGKLDFVDAEMNCSLTNVTVRNTKEKDVKFESFYIKGTNIRFVHIPDDISVIGTIQGEINTRMEARVKGLQSSRFKHKPGKEQRENRKIRIEKKIQEARAALTAQQLKTPE